MSYVHGAIRAGGASAVDDLAAWDGPDVGAQFATDDVAIAAPSRDSSFACRPVQGDGDVRCWVVGAVYGYDASAADRPPAHEASRTDGRWTAEYEPRPANVDPAQYCLALYERDGMEFVRGLNGNFTLIVHDEPAGRVSFCTDRFGTVPVYWTHTHDGAFVFSTNVQLLPAHSRVDTDYHPGYLHEYLAFRRTFGTTTPLEGVRRLQPGTVTTTSLADGSRTTEQYWRPRYRPRDEPFEWFVDEFTERFRTVLEEWTRDGQRYGVLLSGGSDSRLVLAGLEDATAFHINDWMNREARTAERAAMTADAEFRLLQRGPQFHIDGLRRNRWAPSFNGYFTLPHTGGFEDDIASRVDGLLSGLYGDSLFREYGVPSPTVPIGRLGSVTLPVERSVDTVADFVDYMLETAHDEFDASTDLRRVLESNVHREADGVVHHGVTYDSLEELVYYGNCYPLSNDDDMRVHTSLRRLLPYRSPFLDNRLIDLSLSMPVEYRLRRNVVDRAIERLAPELAAIPHADTGVPLARGFPAKYAGRHLLAFRDKVGRSGVPSKPYLTEGPWLDDAELLRSFDFAEEVLEANEGLADALPGHDADSIRELYRTHRRGEDRLGELYTLLTVLTMPVTECVLDADAETAAPARDRRIRPPSLADGGWTDGDRFGDDPADGGWTDGGPTGDDRFDGGPTDGGGR